MHVCSAANSCRACRPGGGARGLMMTALSKQAQSMHLCVCFGRCQNRFQLLFLACHRQAGKNVRKRSRGWDGEWFWAARTVRVGAYPYVVSEVKS